MVLQQLQIILTKINQGFLIRSQSTLEIIFTKFNSSFPKIVLFELLDFCLMHCKFYFKVHLANQKFTCIIKEIFIKTNDEKVYFNFRRKFALKN